MNIFISHSSQNKDYGCNLVELLTGIGIKHNNIIFTSDEAYSVPTGADIFEWLKEQIKDKPYVIYLLSDQYYKSIPCLNEMGAAWVVESEHSIMYTPSFDILSHNFRSGVINPREKAIKINNKNEVLGFVDQITKKLQIEQNLTLINNAVETFITKCDPADVDKDGEADVICDSLFDKDGEEENILLLHYIKKTGRKKLRVGWQNTEEIKDIKAWERVHNITTKLSNDYDNTIRRFEMGGLTMVSKVTCNDITKEVVITFDIINMCNSYRKRMTSVLRDNYHKHTREKLIVDDDLFPF